MLDHDKEARKLFRAALKIEPNSRKIKETVKQMDEINSQKAQYADEVKKLQLQHDAEIVEIEKSMGSSIKKIQKYNIEKYLESMNVRIFLAFLQFPILKNDYIFLFSSMQIKFILHKILIISNVFVTHNNNCFLLL